MIELEIDGRKLSARQGEMIIQVADEAGIYIPRFCYHKHLSIAANCRMCLVEVEKAPKTLPACATPVAAGMKVFTQSEKTIESQKNVMEFLLINHPLDCPICDQGGECELQDLSMGYGKGVSRYNERKRSFKDTNLGPLISSEMTRCIQCTRCVRFGAEVAGMRELGATNRGEVMEIGTYVEHVIQSEVSGNIIDLCPVGALTSKPYRFTARAWEMKQHPAIAPHDCLGSNIFIHSRGEEYSPVRQVMRVVPRENSSINEVWLADRDRYSYEGIHSENRVTQPLIKQGGVWQETSWEQALQHVVEYLRAAGPTQMGALISPSATVEEHYLLQKLLRGSGCHNIDHRLQQTDFSDQEYSPLYPSLGLPIAELEQLEAFFLIGADVRMEQPLANIRLRKAALKGATTLLANPMHYDSNFPVTESWLAAGPDLINVLAKILKALQEQSSYQLPESLRVSLDSVTPGEVEQAAATKWLQAEKKAILLGAYALNHPQASLVRHLSYAIAQCSQASWGVFSTGANSAGAHLAGAVPHRGVDGENLANPGLNARSLFEKPLPIYILFNVEPELDCADSAAALRGLSAADKVISLATHRGGAMEEYADVILPIASFAENSGTYVNAEGCWQSMIAAVLPLGKALPGWRLLANLGSLLELPGFDYVAAEVVRDELKGKLENISFVDPLSETAALSRRGGALGNHAARSVRARQVPERQDPVGGDRLRLLYRITEWPMYRIDSMVRNAKSLQATLSAELAAIRIHPQLANELQLKAGEWVTAIQEGSEVKLKLILDERIAPGYVAIPAGLEATAGFGDAMGEIELM